MAEDSDTDDYYDTNDDFGDFDYDGETLRDSDRTFEISSSKDVIALFGRV